MKPDFWQARWENRQIGFHQGDVNKLLQEHWSRLSVPAGAKVLVPLCGKSLDMVWLRAQGYRVLGVEFIRIALRDFFNENGLAPVISAQPPFEHWDADGISLWWGDFFELTAADVGDVAAVYDRAALIALPVELRRRYVEKMADILPARAQTLLITLSYPKGEMNGPPFSVTDAEVRSLYGANFEIEHLSARDALEENLQLHSRGLTQLTEQAYRLRPLRGD